MKICSHKNHVATKYTFLLLLQHSEVSTSVSVFDPKFLTLSPLLFTVSPELELDLPI